MIRKSWLVVFPSLLIFTFWSLQLSAQNFFGSIVGTVADSTGAIVPGATVSATDLGTNEIHKTRTDAAGEYRFVNLVPASYKVVVEAAGFKRTERPSIQVTVDSTIRVDVAMQVGAATETVEVNTQPPLLQTETGSLGDTIEGSQVQEMPLNGRNTMNLIALSPGVVPQGGTQGSAAVNNGVGGTSSGAWGNYQIGGGMPLQDSMFVDGATVNILVHNNAVFVPTPDVIQEFKVETSGVSPEFGRFGGGIISMTTKSGTNSFHGTAYEYLRNNVLNANYYFSKQSGAARPQWTQNQFGLAGGGPIWKDKAFFFGSWEAIHIRTGAPVLTNIPTPALQAGVFPGKITDPRGLCNIQQTSTGGTVNGVTAPAGAYYITNLSTCEDPTGATLAKFYPSTPNNPSNTSDNWYKTESEGDDGYQLTGRFDYDMTSKQRYFARFTLWPLTDEAPNIVGINNGFNTLGSQNHNHTNNIVVGDTYTLNPTTVVDIRADYIRQYGDAVPPASTSNVNLAQFGTGYANIATYGSFDTLPYYSFSSGTQLHNLFSFGYNNITRSFYNTYHLSGSLTKIIGKHTLKFGGEGRLMQYDTANDGTAAGSFAFSDDLAGDEWANLLMGSFDTGSIQTIKKTTSFMYYSGFYAWDSWRATQKLTLNYGLRWESPGALAENGDNDTVLEPTTVDPATGVTGTIGLVATSLYGNRSTLVPYHKAFGPRFGFAYSLGHDTVVRGGYSLSYISNDMQAVFASSSPINAATTTNTNKGTVSYTLSNPFPATAQNPLGFTLASGRANFNSPPFTATLIGQAVSDAYPYEPYNYSQEMDLSVGHQLPGDILVEVSGAHTLGIHLASLSKGLNQIPDQYLSLGSALSATTCPVGATTCTPGSAINLTFDGVKLSSAYQTYGQTLRPFPAYTNYSNPTDYHGTSSYNALELTVKKRFRSAGEIGGAYTWMKMITDTDTIFPTREITSGASGVVGEGQYQDYGNRRAERALYSYDVPNRLVINYVLNLPFGHGQRLASDLKGPLDVAVSGWSLDGITTLASGYPLYLYDASNNLNKYFGAATIRPNYTAGCTKTIGGSGFARTQPKQVWFNTACFAAPGSYAFGNESRTDDAIKTSGVDNFDFDVAKSTPLHDKAALQFRVEFYNIFNRVQFAPPVTQADSTQFGQTLKQANQPRLIQGSLRLNF